MVMIVKASSTNHNHCPRFFSLTTTTTRTTLSILTTVIVTVVLGCCYYWRREADNDALFGSSDKNHDSRRPNSHHPWIGQPLPPWQEGYLDIHHIHAGVSVSTFTIFPDGTTLLTDAGDQDLVEYVHRAAASGDAWKGRLRAADPWPDPRLRPSQQIAAYVLEMWPHPQQQRPMMDYMLNTHLDSDHIGQLYQGKTSLQPKSQRGDYHLSGIPEIGEHFDLGLILDRGYPNYDFPYDLVQHWVPKRPIALRNYIQFIQTHVAAGRTKAAKFQVGSDQQIVPKYNPNSRFAGWKVRNIKSNLDVSPALPNNRTVHRIPGQLWPNQTTTQYGRFDENELSNAYVLQYGQFRYYEGGDQEYHPKLDTPKGIPATTLDMDTVTPVAQMAGKVDVATLNHHGHGVRPAFTQIMDPKVLVLQGWCSDHMPENPVRMLMQEPRPERQERRTSGAVHGADGPHNNAGNQNFDNRRHLFATKVFSTRLQELGPELAQYFESVLGHVVIRVSPPPMKRGLKKTTTHNDKQHQEYWVYILNGQRIVTAVHGPFYPET